MSAICVLLVDDDPGILQGLGNTFKKEGFKVVTATDGEEAILKFRKSMPDIIVLDLMLPKKDGMEVCKEIRQFSDVPILMLTAKDDSIDKILGLELGADDYVTKPFNSREVVARIRSILRRVNKKYPGTTIVLDGGRVRINTLSRSIIVDDEEKALTPTEFDLLIHLVQHPNRVFSRQSLLEQVWGYDYLGDLRTVDVHIRRLRQKIEKDPAKPTIIITKFGVGYVYQSY